MKKFLSISFIVGILIALGIGFWLGIKWQRFSYLDTCLDMGGGMNPGGYEICMIEK
jgi:hypothetical protein